MLNWFFSRPLQIKFFVSTILLVSIGLLVIMLNVFQMLSQFLTHYAEQDLQQRTQILAMAMMDGPAAHKPSDMKRLLQDVSGMHGYCFLTVHDTEGRLLASAGDVPDTASAGERKGCIEDTTPLIHDGKPFGALHYGADTSFIGTLELRLRSKLFIITVLWFAIGVVAYSLLVRKLVKPLQAITRASESMAQGNLNIPMPQGLPQDELGKLAVSFNNMAAALRERIESQQSYGHALYAEQARLNALVSILPVGICFVDPARHVQYINIECRQLWGLSESEDYIGRNDTDLIAHASNQLEHPVAFMQHVGAALKVYGISAPFDTRLCSGKVIRSRSCVVPDATGDRYIGRIWMFEDVTQEYAHLHEAEVRAERDSVTGLYNRRRFEEDLEQLFAQVERNKGSLALLYFDLDDFKAINDSHGHAAGDKILKGIAQALTLQSRRNENLYRLGGDEFGILIADTERHHIESLAQRVISTIAQLQFHFAGHQVDIRCSMGISFYSPDVHPHAAVELMQQADAAMYQAKRDGKNRWHLFDPKEGI